MHKFKYDKKSGIKCKIFGIQIQITVILVNMCLKAENFTDVPRILNLTLSLVFIDYAAPIEMLKYTFLHDLALYLKNNSIF